MALSARYPSPWNDSGSTDTVHVVPRAISSGCVLRVGFYLVSEQEDYRPNCTSPLGYPQKQRVSYLYLIFNKISISNVCLLSVPVTIKGGPATPEIKSLPKHKKNAEIGEKKTVYTSSILVEQEDAISFDDQEEVRMDTSFFLSL